MRSLRRRMYMNSLNFFEARGEGWEWVGTDRSRYGAEAVKDLPSVLTHGEFSKHITLSPSSKVLQSPVTEVLLAYFPSDISAAEKVLAAAQFQQYIEKGLGGSADVKGVSFG